MWERLRGTELCIEVGCVKDRSLSPSSKNVLGPREYKELGCILSELKQDTNEPIREYANTETLNYTV